MIDFFRTAWTEWGQYGARGVQDDSFKLEEVGSTGSPGGTPALVPCNASPRCQSHRAGKTIYSQVWCSVGMRGRWCGNAKLQQKGRAPRSGFDPQHGVRISAV